MIKNFYKIFSIGILGISMVGCAGTGSVNGVYPSVSGAKKDIASAVEYQNKIGTILTTRGDLNKAKKPFLKAIELDPKSADSYAGLAVIFQIEKDEVEADKYYNLALKNSPNDPRINNNYGQFLFNSGRFIEACDKFEIASKDKFYDKREMSLLNLGNCQLRTFKPRAATESFETVTNINPNNSFAYLGVSKAMFDRNRLMDSKVNLEIFRSKYGSHTKSSAKLGLDIATKENELAEIKKYELMLENIFNDS